jgi:1-acyl-sn-glycerol-3-phosphate acyltransferase
LDATVWGGELINPEDLPTQYPVVFVGNHADALGPIAVTSSLPVRVYPWVIGDMVDPNHAADYLRMDFVEPQLHVPPSFSLGLAKLISIFSVQLLGAIRCIPVWTGEALQETFRLSVDALAEGRSLLIFPEDPEEPCSELYGMRPFKRGFARLGEMYYARTRRILRFYPLAVHVDACKIKLGPPVSFSPFNKPVAERIRIRNVLESSIHKLFLSMTYERYTGIPLPH